MAGLKEYNGHYCESEYEYAFIGFLKAEGWIYTSGNNIRRVTKRDVLIADDFKKFIADTNPDLTVKVKSFAPRQIQRRLLAALVTLSRKVF